MIDATFLGNCSSIIDWAKVIDQIKFKDPEIRPSLDKIIDSRILEFSQKWEDANYRHRSQGGNVEWQMFYPGKHFDQEVVDKFCEFTKIKNYSSVWISRIMPGCCIPPHFDILINRVQGMRRIHCHISQPELGHVFVLKDTCFYNQNPGDIFGWKNPGEWHMGFNGGFNPKYLFNIY